MHWLKLLTEYKKVGRLLQMLSSQRGGGVGSSLERGLKGSCLDTAPICMGVTCTLDLAVTTGLREGKGGHVAGWSPADI